jgi:hypothetical protein
MNPTRNPHAMKVELAGVGIEAQQQLPGQGLPLREKTAVGNDEAGVPLSEIVLPQPQRTTFRPGIGQLFLLGAAVVITAPWFLCLLTIVALEC